MPPTTLKIATYNVNSIRTRWPLVLDWLQREQPYLLALQETKTPDPDFPQAELQASGYHVVFRGQPAHAGVALLSREVPLDVRYGLDDGEPPDEARLIRAQIGPFTVINTYIPQGRDITTEHFTYKLRWLERLRAYFARHFTPQDALIWLGDFNVAPEPIDVYDPKRLVTNPDFHPDARAALERIRAWGWVDLFRLHHPDEPGHYTFWDYRVQNAQARGLGWRIDHIWATEPVAQRCVAAWIDTIARQVDKPSDHTFLVAELTP